jgi:hypothetical protein
MENNQATWIKSTVYNVRKFFCIVLPLNTLGIKRCLRGGLLRADVLYRKTRRFGVSDR